MKTFRLLLFVLMAGLFVACGDSGKKEGGEGETNNGGTENPEGNAETNTPAPAETYMVSNAMSTIHWFGSKEDGAHFGKISIAGGSVNASDAGLTGEVTINLNTMTVEDETPDDMKQKLIGHLSSEDFFDVANNPNAVLKITGATEHNGPGETKPEGVPAAFDQYAVAEATHIISGSLTIKGKEESIQFPAKVEIADGKITTTALITFDRRQYGMRFKSDTESKVNPMITIGLNVGAMKAGS